MNTTDHRYQNTRAFSDRTLPLAINELNKLTHAQYIYESDIQQDRKEGIDLICFPTNTTISVRIRKYKYINFRNEFTVRRESGNGGTTEADKFPRGIMSDFIFYGFVNTEETDLVNWVYIDLKRIWKEMGESFSCCEKGFNSDGSSFYGVPWTCFPNSVINKSQKFKGELLAI